MYHNKTAVTLYGQCPKCKFWNYASDVIMHGPFCIDVNCFCCLKKGSEVTVVCDKLKHELPNDVTPIN